MSLLADLLSKAKRPQPKREIPPNLKDIVSISRQQSARKRKILFASLLAAGAIMSGVLIAYFIQSPKGSGVSSQQLIDTREHIESKTPTAPSTTEKGQEAKKSETSLSKVKKPQKVKKALQDKGYITQEIKPETKMKEDKKQVEERKRVAEERRDLGGDSERDAYLYSAREYEDKKDYRGALFNYKKALEIDKGNFAIMNNIAYIFLQLGLFENSIKYTRMAVDTKDDYIPALINLGIAYAKMRDVSTAETYLSRANTIEPDNGKVILNLAILYEKVGDYNKASEYFSRLFKLGDTAGSVGIARIYERMGKLEEALNLYKQIDTSGSLDKETRQMVRQRILFLDEKLELKTRK